MLFEGGSGMEYMRGGGVSQAAPDGGGGAGVRSEFKQIQFKFKSSQNLIDPKGTISGSKNLKQNIFVNDVKKGITFSIGTSSC
jgi:hypothetical protein